MLSCHANVLASSLGSSGLTEVCLRVVDLGARHVHIELPDSTCLGSWEIYAHTRRRPATRAQHELDRCPARQGVLVQHLLLHLQNHLRSAMPLDLSPASLT